MPKTSIFTSGPLPSRVKIGLPSLSCIGSPSVIQAAITQPLAAFADRSKRHRHMQQADALHVRRDDALRRVALLLDAASTRALVSASCFCRPASVVRIRVGHFRFQVGGLLLQFVFAGGTSRRRLLLRAQFARFGDQILLANEAAFELGEIEFERCVSFCALRANRK